MEENRDKIREKLIPYIQEFDNNNRGNRLSKELISGMAQFLEDIIVDIIKEIEPKGDK